MSAPHAWGEALRERARLLAGDRAATRRGELALAAERDFPGLAARIEGEAVIIEGRGLLDRWLREANLRAITERAGR